MQQEVRKHEANWAQAHVLYGLKIEAEKKFAAVLREIHDRLGTEEWLKQIKVEFGWGQAAAYQHMDPAGMAKARERQSVRDNIPQTVESTKEVEPSEEEQEDLSREEKTVRKNCATILGALHGNIKALGVEEARKMFHDDEHKKFLIIARELHRYLTLILKGDPS
jgi:hypothetical protein